MPSPIRQLTSLTSYPADGVTTVWNFTFDSGYLDRSHVKAYHVSPGGFRTEIPVTLGMFLGDFQLSISPPVANGYELTIYRATPTDAPLVNFADRAALTELSLDTATKQALFVAAEMSDALSVATERLAAVSEFAGIAETAATNAAASAASAAASQASATASAATATTKAGEAATSATAAAASQADALASKNAAATSAGNAATSEANALASKNTAVTKAAEASTSATNAGTSETNALASKNAAQTSATNAGTSEANALTSKNAAAASASTAAAATSRFPGRNRIINGGFQVAQRSTAAASSAALFSQCDRWMSMVNAGTGISGNLGRALSNGDTASGWWYGYNACSWTAGSPQWLQRIESANVQDFAGQSVTLSAKVFQNTGASRNYALMVYKCAVKDDWTSAATTVAASAGIAVASGVPTAISLTFAPTAADVANGLMVYVYDTATSTIVSKSMFIGDVQLELGATPTPFELRNYTTELSMCQRYYSRMTATSGNATFGVGYSSNATTALVVVPFPVRMRVTPTMEQSGTAGHYQLVGSPGAAACTVVPTLNANTGVDGALIQTSVASGLTAGQATVLISASSSAYLGFAAEL
jgi:hypothetical protein